MTKQKTKTKNKTEEITIKISPQQKKYLKEVGEVSFVIGKGEKIIGVVTETKTKFIVILKEGYTNGF